MSSSSNLPTMASLAKCILDLDGLLRLLSTDLHSSAKHRVLAHGLDHAIHSMQVLRMVIVMDRPDFELTSAALELRRAIALLDGQTQGRRLDLEARSGIRLARTLAERLHREVSEHVNVSTQKVSTL